MTDKEIKEVIGPALEEISLEIENKCGFIAENCANYSNINDLNILIQQFLALREIWNEIPYDDED